MTSKISLKLFGLTLTLALFALAFVALADSLAIDFESYTLGTIDGQDGWQSDGANGSGCALYDHAVSSSLGTAGFGSQSLRISNAVTSGCFGDQTFSKSLADEAGEAVAHNDGMSGGTRQPHFVAQFDIASAVPNAEQPGLFASLSPDRGDGARMSYLSFADGPSGIAVTFFDVQGTSNPANFVSTSLGTISRSAHTIKFDIEFVDGPSNDIVKIYIDGALVHTGTTWENYYRYDPESNPDLSDESRTVDSLLFRTGGTAVPATAGNGFLFDNLSLSSGKVPKGVIVENGASLINATISRSGTGDNTAKGSSGGNGDKGGKGGWGGDASHNAGGTNNAGKGGVGGRGGKGGSGGAGALIVSGNARSNAGTLNTLNDTFISRKR